jgi:hypothetical protein
LDSFFFLELPRERTAPPEPHALFGAVFPALKPPELPQTVRLRDGPVAFVSLKLLGLGGWTDSVPADVSAVFLRELGSWLDRAAAECGFVRLNFVGGHALFANDSEAQQTQIGFFRGATQFGRQTVEVVDGFREKIGFAVHAAAVFWRGSAVAVHAMDAQAAQADAVGEGCWAGLDIHERFGLPGVAFACPHKEANRFPNMVRASTWQDAAGRSMDLFLVI